MVQAGRAAQHYIQTQVRSSSPLELVVMLYDAALRHTATAIDAMARKDIRTRRDAISKSLAIIGELQSTLNMEQGGDIAVQLDRLYTWMTDALIQATVQQDPGPIHNVRKNLENLRDAWQQIAAAKPVPESAA
ncbi:MAG: flagellar export chaperone FliS [Acidobacteria bacterium]|nr:flagellar export chaperone FliS [Acidobacteriota bacterium]